MIQMHHTVLARKWRPKKFADLVGQMQSVTILKNIITRKRYHHAYLLTGTRGVGKTTIARIIAKALNCLSLVDGEPCGKCSNCEQIDLGRFVDVIEIDAASNTGVDNVRELIEDAKYAPTSGNYKVYIIDEVHMLSKSAFNAMLKTLEEPPSHAIFILATTDLQKVPITILSRCLQLKLRNLLQVEIEKHLAQVLEVEGVAFEQEALTLLARAANGSMRDGLSILDQAIAFASNQITVKEIENMLGVSSDEVIYAILDALCAKDGGRLVNLANEIYQRGDSLEGVLTTLRDKLCIISQLQLALVPENQELSRYAKTISVSDIQLYFEIANLGLEQLDKHSDKHPIFLMTLLRMLAFHIGTDAEKEIIVSQSNFMVKNNIESNVSSVKPLIEKPPVTSTKVDDLPWESGDDCITTPIIEKEYITHVEDKKMPQNMGKAVVEVEDATEDKNEVLANQSDDLHVSSKSSNLEQQDAGSDGLIGNTLSKIGGIDSLVQPHIAKEPQNISGVAVRQAEIHVTEESEKILIKTQDEWFALIVLLKPKFNYLYPILENAKLENSQADKLKLVVDERYQSIFNPEAIQKVQLILSEHFGVADLNLAVSFSEQTSGTLKHKKIEEKSKRHEEALESINNDPNLTKMRDLFSATIIPSSIESKYKEHADV